MLTSRVILLTGERQTGKTTVLSEVVERLRSAGAKVSGLLTRRTGPHDLVVTELRTGASYPLTAPFQDSADSATRNFTMDEVAFARSSNALVTAFPTQVFVLDEIGPLELRHRRGWVQVLDLLRRETYVLAIVVVRPELLGEAVAELPGAKFVVVRVDMDSRQGLGVSLFDTAMAMLASNPVPSQEVSL